MTELFAVMEYRYVDYGGGGGDLCGVFSTTEKAVANIEKLWTEAKHPPEKCVPDEVGNYVIEQLYGEHYFAIEKLVLDEER